MNDDDLAKLIAENEIDNDNDDASAKASEALTTSAADH